VKKLKAVVQREITVLGGESFDVISIKSNDGVNCMYKLVDSNGGTMVAFSQKLAELQAYGYEIEFKQI